MINSTHTTVYCNHHDCGEEVRVLSGTPAYIRRQLLFAHWFIDLESPDQAILIGREEALAAQGKAINSPIESALSPEQIEKLINDPKFELRDDQHYCSLDHAGKDA